MLAFSSILCCRICVPIRSPVRIDATSRSTAEEEDSEVAEESNEVVEAAATAAAAATTTELGREDTAISSGDEAEDATRRSPGIARTPFGKPMLPFPSSTVLARFFFRRPLLGSRTLARATVSVRFLR